MYLDLFYPLFLAALLVLYHIKKQEDSKEAGGVASAVA